MLKFRSGTHGSNEELGRQRGRKGMTECPAYKDSREEFMVKLRTTLGKAFKNFEALEKASFVLGCELWMENFDSVMCTSM